MTFHTLIKQDKDISGEATWKRKYLHWCIKKSLLLAQYNDLSWYRLEVLLPSTSVRDINTWEWDYKVQFAVWSVNGVYLSPLQVTSSLLTPSFILTSCCSMCGTKRTAFRSRLTTRPRPAPERWRCRTTSATTTMAHCWMGHSLIPGLLCIIPRSSKKAPTHTNM